MSACAWGMKWRMDGWLVERAGGCGTEDWWNQGHLYSSDETFVFHLNNFWFIFALQIDTQDYIEPVAKKKEEDQKFSTQHLQWLYPIHYFTHSTTHHHTPVSASSSGRSPISVVLPRRKFMLYDNMSYVANVPSSFIRFGWWMVMLCHCLPCLSCCMPIP